MKKSTLITILVSLIPLNSLYTMEPQKPAIPGSGYHKPLPPIPNKKPASSIVPNPQQPAPVAPKPAQLTFKQEESVQTIIKDIKKITENSVAIAKNAVNLGKTASLSNILSNGRDTAIIVAKLGMSSALIADVYLNIEKISEGSPEQKALARKRILAVLDSSEFKASQAELIKLAADDSLPEIVRVPLQKFASQLAELPGLIVKKYLGQEYISQAR